MNNGFKIGEIAVLCNADHFIEYNNMECEILEDLKLNRVMHMNEMKKGYRVSYFVQMKDGMKLNAAPYQLKKRKKTENFFGRKLVRSLSIL